MKRSNICILIMGCLLCMCGCSQTNTIPTIEKSEQISEVNKMGKKEVELLMTTIGIDKDCAEGIVEKFETIGVTSIKDVRKLESKSGYAAIVVDDNGKEYFIGMGALGYLDVIRSGSASGEVLYAVIE